jgi:DNA uptake protein ComE-like DNA-binding protein
LSYESVVFGCCVTVLVSGAVAATEPGIKTAARPRRRQRRPSVRDESLQHHRASYRRRRTSKETLPSGHPPGDEAVKPDAKKAPAEPVKKVDLNNASLAELKTLPTVGDAEAKKIIAHRPYKSKGELVTKAGLPEGVYHAVKRKVELQTPRKPAPKK